MKHKFASVYGERFADLVASDEAGKSFSFRFIHDVNCMLLGEMAEGAGKGFDRVALVTLGTGLGFAMSLDGQLLMNELGSPLLKKYGIQCLLFGGQISRSYSLLAQAVEDGLRDVPSLQYVGPVPDIGNATFNGLKTLKP